MDFRSVLFSSVNCKDILVIVSGGPARSSSWIFRSPMDLGLSFLGAVYRCQLTFIQHLLYSRQHAGHCGRCHGRYVCIGPDHLDNCKSFIFLWRSEGNQKRQ